MKEAVNARIKKKADGLNLLLFELEEEGFDDYFPNCFDMVMVAATLLYKALERKEQPKLYLVKE